jgi:hypothetical protein
MDYQTAFDTVPHKRLLQKMRAYGIKDQIHGWVKSFLTDRRQIVMVNGENSTWKDVHQAFHRDPFLFPYCLYSSLTTYQAQ